MREVRKNCAEHCGNVGWILFGKIGIVRWRGRKMAEMVTIFANGKARQVRSSQTVSEMIRDMKLAPSSVLVERNGEALLRHEWAERKVEHGDRLEIVRVVAGG
jgi:thiamine biosynthesis protein ThiS